jgi:hypothetical protein
MRSRGREVTERPEAARGPVLIGVLPIYVSGGKRGGEGVIRTVKEVVKLVLGYL